MDEDAAKFHRRVARELTARYVMAEDAPDGWRETTAWHWAQGAAFAEAADDAIEVAQSRIARLDFAAARRWAERALEHLDRLDLAERRAYDLRAYAVALAVLEFGGHYREALDYAQRMVRAARSGGRDAQAQALLALGRMQRELGQLVQAETTLHEARALAENEESGALEADVRFHLAKVHQLQGRHIEALQELQLAQEEHAQTDDRIKLARVFTGMGDVYRVLGAAREALRFYQRALGLEQGRGNPMGQAILKDKIALALLALGRFDEAEIVARESLQLRELIGDTVGQARSYSVLGTVSQRLGNYQQAIDQHERALVLEEQTQNQRGQNVALLHLGDAFSALRNYEEAGNFYRRAHALAQGSSDGVALVRALERIGDLAADQMQREAANAAWVEALRMREALGHADEAAALRERLKTGARP